MAHIEFLRGVMRKVRKKEEGIDNGIYISRYRVLDFKRVGSYVTLVSYNPDQP
jgi:hypothetical protein